LGKPWNTLLSTDTAFAICSIPRSVAVVYPTREVLPSTTRNAESTEQDLDSTKALNLPSTGRGSDELKAYAL